MTRLRCAEIVFAMTRTLDGPAEQLSAARRVLASLVQARLDAGADASLPTGTPMPAPDAAERAIAEACLADADAAVLPPQYSVLIWPGVSAVQPGTAADPVPSDWTALPGAIDAWGPFATTTASNGLAAGSPVWVYRKSDPAGTLFYSRLTGTIAGGAVSAKSPAPGSTASSDARPRWRGIWYALAALLVFLIAAGAITSSGITVRQAAASFADLAKDQLGPNGACAPPANLASGIASVPAGWLRAFDGTPGACLKGWGDSYAAVYQARWAISSTSWLDAIVDRVRNLLLSISITPDGPRLWPPFVLVLAGFLLLFMAAGKAVTNHPLGGLIDERNRISLTRSQLFGWSLLLIASIATLGLFNVGFGGGDWALLTRAAATEAAAAPGSAQPGVLGALLDNARLFPAMNATLWTLLGFSVGTTAISALLTNRGREKVEVDPDVPLAEIQPGDPGANAITVRPDMSSAAIADLVLGETLGKTGIVDIGRVQHLAITALLLVAYASLVLALIARVDGYLAVWVLQAHQSIFAEMPALDSTFIALLTVTHVGLLGGKLADRGRS